MNKSKKFLKVVEGFTKKPVKDLDAVYPYDKHPEFSWKEDFPIKEVKTPPQDVLNILRNPKLGGTSGKVYSITSKRPVAKEYLSNHGKLIGNFKNTVCYLYNNSPIVVDDSNIWSLSYESLAHLYLSIKDKGKGMERLYQGYNFEEPKQ